MGGHFVGYDQGDDYEDLLNQTDPMETSMRDFVNDAPEDQLPTYEPSDDELEKADKAIRKKQLKKFKRKRQAKEARLQEEVRQKLEADFSSKLERMKNDLEKQYLAKLAEARAELEAKYKELYESDEEPTKRIRTFVISSSEEGSDVEDSLREKSVAANVASDAEDDDRLRAAPTTVCFEDDDPDFLSRSLDEPLEN